MNVATQSNPLRQSLQGLSPDMLNDRVREYLAERDVRAVSQEKLLQIFQTEFLANHNQAKHVMVDLAWHHQKGKWGGVDYVRAI